MKNIFKGLLAVALVVGVTNTTLAAEPAAQEVNLNATNLTQEYPAAVPGMTVPQLPSSLDNNKEVLAYVAAVQEYMKQAQLYIDGATADLNKIAEKRNNAITEANKVVADYNNFFAANSNDKKK